VPEEEAYDQNWADEDGFGDGKSIVSVSFDLVQGDSLALTLWIRPDEERAPKDSGGRAMTGYLARADLRGYKIPEEIDLAVEWLVGCGIVESWAREQIALALARVVEETRKRELALELLGKIEGVDNKTTREMLNRIERESASEKRAAGLLSDFVSDNPDCVTSLWRELNSRR
jgi:hypothetical protein